MYYYYYNKERTTLLSVTREAYANGVVIGKYHFVPGDCPRDLVTTDVKKQNILVVENAICQTDEAWLTLQKTIVRKDSTKAYSIFVSKKNE